MHRHRRQKAAADGQASIIDIRKRGEAVGQQPGFRPVSARSPAYDRRTSPFVLTRVRFAIALPLLCPADGSGMLLRRKDARRIQLVPIQESGDFPSRVLSDLRATQPNGGI